MPDGTDFYTIHYLVLKIKASESPPGPNNRTVRYKDISRLGAGGLFGLSDGDRGGRVFDGAGMRVLRRIGVLVGVPGVDEDVRSLGDQHGRLLEHERVDGVCRHDDSPPALGQGLLGDVGGVVGGRGVQGATTDADEGLVKRVIVVAQLDGLFRDHLDPRNADLDGLGVAVVIDDLADLTAGVGVYQGQTLHVVERGGYHDCDHCTARFCRTNDPCEKHKVNIIIHDNKFFVNITISKTSCYYEIRTLLQNEDICFQS